jgi:hypothetical protein
MIPPRQCAERLSGRSCISDQGGLVVSTQARSAYEVKHGRVGMVSPAFASPAEWQACYSANGMAA